MKLACSEEELIADPPPAPPSPAPRPANPVLHQLVRARQGWLDLDPENMAAVFCANGKARTSVLLGCFLRFEGEESTALAAYQRVWAKRDPEQEPEQVRDWEEGEGRERGVGCRGCVEGEGRGTCGGCLFACNL